MATLVLTFVVMRVWLYFTPNADFDVAGYNIHHLYTGLLLVTFCGIPLVLFPRRSRLLDAATVGFGIGLSLALDEWVYLIATDGSNDAYLLPVSFWGAVVVIGIACVYVLMLWLWQSRKAER